MDRNEAYMKRCLELAGNGLGAVAPNPMVGSVVVHGDDIIGEGYHQAAGKPHAEVVAIRAVKDPALLKNATLYVNLEPCNHVGKTPPCTDLILQSGIPRVVIGQSDPNPLVSGRGISRLQQAGVEVVTGVLNRACLSLNRRFNTFHLKKRPYILLKWAQTRDGFMDLIREPGQPANPAWITDEYCRTLVHKWRTEEPAILVGTRTALMDNPRLNVRAWSGKNPIRLVLDRQGSLPVDLHLFDGSQKTWVFTEHPKPNKDNLEYLALHPDSDDLEQMLHLLYQREIQSVMVEGGSELLSAFIQQNLWDEARIFTGPGTFGKGVAAPLFPFCQDPGIQTGNSRLAICTPT